MEGADAHRSGRKPPAIISQPRSSICTWFAIGTLMTACLLAGCSPTDQRSGGSVQAAPGVTVSAPSGVPRVRGTVVPEQVKSPLAPVAIGDGASVADALRAVGPTVQLTLNQPQPAPGLTVSFHVARSQLSGAGDPFLIEREAGTDTWTAVPSRYDRGTGTVSAAWQAATTASPVGSTVPSAGYRLAAFSFLSELWSVVRWSADVVKVVLKGVLNEVFGGALTQTGPLTCGTSNPRVGGALVTVADSKSVDEIASCAQENGPGSVLVKVTNRNHYPVDLLMPHGATVSVPPGDALQAIAGSLQRWSLSHALVPVAPADEADVTLPVAADSSVRLQTEFDVTAYLLSILGTGLTVLEKVAGGWLAKLVKGVDTGLARATCVLRLFQEVGNPTQPLNLELANRLAGEVFQCMMSVARETTFTVIVDVLEVVASLWHELLAGVWGIIDTLTGAATHSLTVTVIEHVTVTITSTRCADCVIVAWQAHSRAGDGQEPATWKAAMTGGKAVLSVPWAMTPGMAFTIDSLTVHVANARADLVLGYGGVQPGARLSGQQAATMKTGSACWAGAASPSIEIGIGLYAYSDPTLALFGGTYGTQSTTAWALPTIPTTGPMQTTYNGALGDQNFPDC